MRVIGAAIPSARPKTKYVPAFTVFRLDGEYKKTVAKMVPFGNKKDRDGNPKNFRLEYEEVTAPRGFLVVFPRGHSIHIDSYEKMEEMGFTDTEVPLVDEDGEAVGSIPNQIRKAKKVEDSVNA